MAKKSSVFNIPEFAKKLTDYNDNFHPSATYYLYKYSPYTLIGYLVGQVIIHRQESHEFLPKVTSPSGYQTDYCYYLNPKNPQPIEQRKIIFYFSGNGSTPFSHFLQRTREGSEQPFEPSEKNYNEFMGMIGHKYDFYGICHLKNVTTPKAEAECAASLMKMLLMQGYKAENITVIGHSMGGGKSALMLHYLIDNNILQGEKLNRYINYKSFSKNSLAVSFLAGFAPRFIKIMLYCKAKKQLMMHLDSKSSQNIKNNLIFLFCYLYLQYNSITIKDLHNLDQYTKADDHTSGSRNKQFNKLIAWLLYVTGWEIPVLKILLRNDLPVELMIIVTSDNDQILGKMSTTIDTELAKSRSVELKYTNTDIPECQQCNIDHRTIAIKHVQPTNSNSAKITIANLISGHRDIKPLPHIVNKTLIESNPNKAAITK